MCSQGNFCSLKCQFLWSRPCVGSRSCKYSWQGRGKPECCLAVEECTGKQDNKAAELEQISTCEWWSNWISVMALHGSCFSLEEGFICLIARQFFSSYSIGSNKRYYLFLQPRPLIFPIHCKLGQREPQGAMPCVVWGFWQGWWQSPRSFSQAGWCVLNVSCPLDLGGSIVMLLKTALM